MARSPFITADPTGGHCHEHDLNGLLYHACEGVELLHTPPEACAVWDAARDTLTEAGCLAARTYWLHCSFALRMFDPRINRAPLRYCPRARAALALLYPCKVLVLVAYPDDSLRLWDASAVRLDAHGLLDNIDGKYQPGELTLRECYGLLEDVLVGKLPLVDAGCADGSGRLWMRDEVEELLEDLAPPPDALFNALEEAAERGLVCPLSPYKAPLLAAVWAVLSSEGEAGRRANDIAEIINERKLTRDCTNASGSDFESALYRRRDVFRTVAGCTYALAVLSEHSVHVGRKPGIRTVTRAALAVALTLTDTELECCPFAVGELTWAAWYVLFRAGVPLSTLQITALINVGGLYHSRVNHRSTGSDWVLCSGKNADTGVIVKTDLGGWTLSPDLCNVNKDAATRAALREAAALMDSGVTFPGLPSHCAFSLFTVMHRPGYTPLSKASLIRAVANARLRVSTDQVCLYRNVNTTLDKYCKRGITVHDPPIFLKSGFITNVTYRLASIWEAASPASFRSQHTVPSSKTLVADAKEPTQSETCESERGADGSVYEEEPPSKKRCTHFPMGSGGWRSWTFMGNGWSAEPE